MAKSFVNKYVVDLHVKGGEERLEKLSSAVEVLKALIATFNVTSVR